MAMGKALAQSLSTPEGTQPADPSERPPSVSSPKERIDAEQGVSKTLNDRYFKPNLSDEAYDDLKDTMDAEDFLVEGRTRGLTPSQVRDAYHRRRRPESLD